MGFKLSFVGVMIQSSPSLAKIKTVMLPETVASNVNTTTYFPGFLVLHLRSLRRLNRVTGILYSGPGRISSIHKESTAIGGDQEELVIALVEGDNKRYTVSTVECYDLESGYEEDKELLLPKSAPSAVVDSYCQNLPLPPSAELHYSSGRRIALLVAEFWLAPAMAGL